MSRIPRAYSGDKPHRERGVGPQKIPAGESPGQRCVRADDAVADLYVQVRNFAHGAVFQRQFEERVRGLIDALVKRERAAVWQEAVRQTCSCDVHDEFTRRQISVRLRACAAEEGEG